MNGYGKLHRCTDKDGAVLDFFFHLAVASSPSANSSNEHTSATAGHPPHRPPHAIPIAGGR